LFNLIPVNSFSLDCIVYRDDKNSDTESSIFWNNLELSNIGYQRRRSRRNKQWSYQEIIQDLQ